MSSKKRGITGFYLDLMTEGTKPLVQKLKFHDIKLEEFPINNEN